MVDYRNIESDTLNNNYYRNVIYTTSNFQLVLMSLKPNECIPLEIHPTTTQFIRVESGYGLAKIDDTQYELHDGISVTIPPGSPHLIVNMSSVDDLKIYSIYTPPEHPPNKKNIRQPGT